MDDICVLVLKNYVGTLANTESIIEKYERWKLLISVQFVLVCYNDMIHMLDK